MKSCSEVDALLLILEMKEPRLRESAVTCLKSHTDTSRKGRSWDSNPSHRLQPLLVTGYSCSFLEDSTSQGKTLT